MAIAQKQKILLARAQLSDKKTKEKEQMNKLTASHAGTHL